MRTGVLHKEACTHHIPALLRAGQYVYVVGLVVIGESAMCPSRSLFESASAEPQFEIVGLDDLNRSTVREGLAYWNGLRGARSYPSRAEILPRGIAQFLANTILIKVIDGGDDFEVAIAGDQVVRSYRAAIIHRRLSEIAADMPKIAAWWVGIYRQVCRTGVPCAVHFRSGFDGESVFVDAETVLLPLGPAEGPVDHIIGFTNRRFAGA